MRCFLLAVSVDSALDAPTGNYSLFSLVQEIRVPPATHFPGRISRMQVHAHFAVAEQDRGREHLVRFVLRGPTTEIFSDESAITPRSNRHRIRVEGLVFPEFGDLEIGVQWFPSGEQAWIEAPFTWPLGIYPREQEPDDEGEADEAEDEAEADEAEGS